MGWWPKELCGKDKDGSGECEGDTAPGEVMWEVRGRRWCTG